MIKVYFIQLFFFITAYLIFKKFSFLNLFIDKDFTKSQSFHSVETPRYGGIIIALTFLVGLYVIQDNYHIYKVFLFFLITNLLLGVIDDIKIVINPLLRFLFFLISNIFLIILFNLKISEFNFFILDFLNENYFFSVFITFFCIFFVINGSNLIDGFNGLLGIHSLIILLIFTFIIHSQNITELKNINLLLIASVIYFLFLNIPNGKIFLGDCGSFFIGTYIALTTIIIFNQSENISPFYFAIIVYYIFFEIFFSVFRKLYQGKNPFYPDRKHLHMLLYEFVKFKNYKFKNHNFSTSLIINVLYLISILPSFLFFDNDLVCKYYFSILIIGYCILYVFLNRQLKFNEKKN